VDGNMCVGSFKHIYEGICASMLTLHFLLDLFPTGFPLKPLMTCQNS
jgi:hypothetical protein